MPITQPARASDTMNSMHTTVMTIKARPAVAHTVPNAPQNRLHDTLATSSSA